MRIRTDCLSLNEAKRYNRLVLRDSNLFLPLSTKLLVDLKNIQIPLKTKS